MAKRGVIDSFFDLVSLQKQKKKATKAISDYIDLVNSAKPIRIELKNTGDIKEMVKGMASLNKANESASQSAIKFNDISKKIEDTQRKGADSIKDLSKVTVDLADSYKELLEISVKYEAAQKELTARKKDANDELKRGEITEEEYYNRLIEIKDAQIAISVSQQEVTKSLKSVEREAQQAEGSLDQMKAQLLIMQQAYSKFDDETKASDFGKQFAKDAEALATEVNKQKKAFGDFSSNVGRYAESLEGGFDKVAREIARLKKEAATFEMGRDTRGVEAARRSISELEGVQQIALKTNVSYGKTVKSLEREYYNMAAAGNQSVEFLKEFREFVIQSKRESTELRKEITRLGSETKALDGIANAMSFVVSTYEVAAGASALFGQSNEAAEKTIRKLVAIQSVANGVREIGKQITEKGTVANKAYTLVQKQMELLFGQGTAAAQRFSIALKSIGVVAAIGVIIELIQRFSDTGHAAEEAAKDVEKLNIQLERNKSIIDSLSKSDEFDFKTNIEDLKKYYAGRLKLAKDDNEARQIEQDKNKALYESELKYRKEQTAKLYVQEKNAADELEAEKKRQNQAVIDAVNGGDFKKLTELGSEAVKKANEEKLTKLDEQRKAVGEKYQDALRDQILFTSEGGTKIAEAEAEEAQKRRKQREDDAKKDREQLQKDSFEYYKSQMNLLIKQQRDLVAIGSGDTRNNARIKQNELEKELISAIAEYEVNQKGVTSIKIKEINLKMLEDQRISDRDRLLDIEKFGQDERKALEDNIDETAKYLSERQAEIDKKALEEKQQHINDQQDIDLAHIQNSYDAQLVALDQQYAKDMAAAKGNDEAKLSIQRDYDEKKLKLQTDLQVALLKSQIDFLNEQTKLDRIHAERSGDQAEMDRVIKAEAVLSGMRIKLAGITADAQIAENKRVEDSDEERFNKLIERYERVKDLALSLTSAISDLFLVSSEKEKNDIQEQIDLLDKKKQKDIEVSNQTIANTEERAAAITIIEARAQAQKEALERRQRQADERRARFEKAQNIAAAIADTTLAVLRALGDKTVPYPIRVAYAIAAGAIGATKIAALIATPIPKYKYGKKRTDNYEGPAIVGDGGKPELHVSKGRATVTPAVPTLTYVGRDDVIYPDANAMLDTVAGRIHGRTLSAVNNTPEKDDTVNFKMLEKAMKTGFIMVSNTIKNKPEQHPLKLNNFEKTILLKQSNKEYFKRNGFDL